MASEPTIIPQPDAGYPPEPAQFLNSYYEVLQYVDEQTLAHIKDYPLLETD